MGNRERHAFTLVELLIVIAVIAILVAILLPSIVGAREMSRRVHCENNHRQLMAACHSYANTWKDSMPMPNWSGVDGAYAGWLYMPPVPAREYAWTWEFHRTGALWQYIELDSVYRCVSHKEPYKGSGRTTSYLMNGASVAYGRRRTASRIDQFMPGSIMLWETALELWNDGGSHPAEGLNLRHGKYNVRSSGTVDDKTGKVYNKGDSGNTVSCIDGHTEWMTHIRYDEELARHPGRLWCVPDCPTGDH